jgi:hypothetical protein
MTTLRDQARDREVGEDRDAEIAAQQRPQPDRELLDHRPVEAELGPHRRDRLVGRILARDDRRRIARREAQQEEHEQRHHRHHRQGREQSADDVGGHDGSAVATDVCRDDAITSS